MKPALIPVFVALGAGASLWAQDQTGSVIWNHTRPSRDATLSFPRPGRVAKVLVAEGDKVKAGQELVRLDDEAELAQLGQLKAQAEDDTRVRAAQAQLAQRRVDLRKNEVAFKDGAATEMEVEHARLEVTISELSLELAEFTRKQDERKYQEARIQHARMQIKSPFDGVIEPAMTYLGGARKPRSLVEPGECVQALEEILRVVKIDPLWIDVTVPLAQARRLRKGDKAVVSEAGTLDTKDARRVLFPTGKIVYIAAVTAPGVPELTVRVEVPNPTHRPAGENVDVKFPTAEKAASADRPGPGKVAARSER